MPAGDRPCRPFCQDKENCYVAGYSYQPHRQRGGRAAPHRQGPAGGDRRPVGDRPGRYPAGPQDGRQAHQGRGGRHQVRLPHRPCHNSRGGQDELFRPDFRPHACLMGWKPPRCYLAGMSGASRQREGMHPAGFHIRQGRPCGHTCADFRGTNGIRFPPKSLAGRREKRTFVP